MAPKLSNPSDMLLIKKDIVCETSDDACHDNCSKSFTVVVDENSCVAHAVGPDGGIIASQLFSTVEELLSDEFQEKMKRAITISAAPTAFIKPTDPAFSGDRHIIHAATTSSTSSPALCLVSPLPNDKPQSPPATTISTLQLEDRSVDPCDYEFYESVWLEAEAAGSLHDDETSELATLLAISRIEEQDKLEEQQRLEFRDADLALAMKLQEEANADFDAIGGDMSKLDSKTAWATLNSTRSFLRSSISNEFPALPTVNSEAPKKPIPSPQECPSLRLPYAPTQRKVIGYRRDFCDSLDASPRTLAAIKALIQSDDERIRHASIWQRYKAATDDDALFQDEVLGSAEKRAILRRAEESHYLHGRKPRAPGGDGSHSDSAGAGGGVSAVALRQMMDASSKTRSEERSATTDGDLLDSRNAPAEYCRKSIRKLVGDMISAGWRPLPGRGGGHYVYQRLVPPTGHKQLLVLPSTPSGINSIHNTHARLQRMDREAAEIRARARAGTQE